MKKLLAFCITALAVLVLCFSPAVTARAQGGTAMDLINAVNSYRAQQGKQPYDVDGELMALAQGQSDYQATIQQCTHTRADGSGPGSYGISAENIACGQDLSVMDAVYYQWTDTLHTATMLGPETGQVGAGMTVSGNTVYYTLAVKRLTGDFNYTPPQQPADKVSAASANMQPLAQSGGVVTTTPNGDGSIAHVIKYGETLVQIADAYGIPLADLISMNKLDPKNPVYYAGQVLLIRLAFTPTPYLTPTHTPRPPTRTPQPTRTPRPTKTATAFHTPLPTFTATAQPLIQLPSIDELGPARPLMAYAFIGISAIGLVVLLLTSFWPKKRG